MPFRERVGHLINAEKVFGTVGLRRVGPDGMPPSGLMLQAFQGRPNLVANTMASGKRSVLVFGLYSLLGPAQWMTKNRSH